MERSSLDNINWDELTPSERTKVQVEKCHRDVAQHLDNELRQIEPYVDPLPSFVRGAQFGAFATGAFNLIFPGMFGVAEWPHWLRMLFAIAFVLYAVHLIVRQQGFMKAQHLDRRLKL